MSLVRYRTNDYSVPTEYGHRDVLVKGYVHEVAIVCGSEVIARHRRSYQREDMVFDPLHYLALLEQKGTGVGSGGAAGRLGVARLLCPSAATVGSAAEQGRQARVCAGAAFAGNAGRVLVVRDQSKNKARRGLVALHRT